MELFGLKQHFVINSTYNSDFFVCQDSFFSHFNSWIIYKLDSLSDYLLDLCVHYRIIYLEYTFQKLFYTYKQRNDTYMHYESISFCL